MINLSLILLDATILTVVFTTFVLGSLLWKPRLWMHDFPPDIQVLMPPKTHSEKRQTLLIALPFFVMVFGGLGLTAARYGSSNGFFWMALHTYFVWQVVNIFDLLIIDFCGMQAVDPSNPPFPGTENAKGYRDYRFHFIGFLKGSVMGVGLAALIAGVTWTILA